MDDAVAARPSSDTWLNRLADLIAEAPVNLVSRADRVDVRTRHLDDCVRVARHLRLAPGTRWMDLGTGGGLPGLVLADAFPAVSWTLVDARAKKIGQVAMFAAALGLENVTTMHARAEEFGATADGRGSFDGVISRAVGSLRDTIALARPFVTTGEIIAIRGAAAADEADRLRSALDRLDIAIDGVEWVDGTIRPTWLVRTSGRGALPKSFERNVRSPQRLTRGGSSDGTA